MSGLLRRIRRPGAAEETRTEPIALPEPAHGSAPTAPDGEPTPAVRADGRPLPAGTGPEDLERRTTTGRRGKLRRRARFLRRARELALRDLGGLVYEARRREQDGGKLVAEKVGRLAAIDEELRGLESSLGTPRADTVLREPGVGGTCPRCGELHASDARFCSNCGLDLTAALAAPEAEPTAAGPEAPEAPAAAQPTAAEPEAPEAPAAAQPEAPEAPAQPTAPKPTAPEASAATQPPTPEASPATEPATAELPPATAEQSGNGRATTAEPADPADRGRPA
jgi:zinc-ribbon domain